MQPVRSRVESPNGAPYYTLYEVRCPGKKLKPRGGTRVCDALWDRREVGSDRAVHQVLCKLCGNLILYRLEAEVVDDRAVVVILSILRPPRTAAE